ncbi:MAG: DNA translocase FtsK 4TM domain-containing protein [Bacteroidetes bacterium]|nr:DNA translocase FtsK 4TM domain-containing protein [Bacteroidota bacterium]MDA0889431.1 DNA translocase FtsK 4TM domain-containing protein [Bacteroidota bacterium]MDA1085339.1 DNA translocase FtsK 4TM domain-containing protein [Bacteroidota bacterium]
MGIKDKFRVKGLNRQQQIVWGAFCILIAILLFTAFISFFQTWKVDQSALGELANREIPVENSIRKLGASLSYILIYQGIGIGAFLIAFMVLVTGFSHFINFGTNKLGVRWIWTLLLSLWLSMVFALISPNSFLLSGVTGYETNAFVVHYIGPLGVACLLLLIAISFLVYQLKWRPENVTFPSKKTPKPKEIEDEVAEVSFDPPIIEETPSVAKKATILKKESTPKIENDVELSVTETEEDEIVKKAKKLVSDFGEVDPTLELKNFRSPTESLLKSYPHEGITINEQELEENKDRIVDTLKNYQIGIADIKATIGPTVTLYEIVPAAGVRISKIKNLEDDIALSLAALGIRIIAPIPGKGTVGIEVPNKNATIVSMRSVILAKKFQEAEMELPLALGKTISNETFVVDLAKMPHLLMAGATGQGKSVGLNAILTSLLYKKHPAEIKLVLVDPKKVELTLFNKIERHYLAKLPDTDEAIITDNKQVINTLNSLCIEMDNRYDLLKNAMCRNIKEYNTKFKERRLNPHDGHTFLPYIVLVIDEFADLIMTAGKEVETPIARLAQLARAIGIHLIIATQRPSVNVITGLIKANFPARIAFRVTSKVDSRTILDSGGADQLIGRGDMLFTQGNNLIRLQCAFVDTSEVEKITDFIGSQRAYPDAHLLPEYVSDESISTKENNIEDRDALFKEAAEVVVNAQQGSASLLQRKLKLGYNRAGRMIDQLEAAGIVGPFEGSKAREVMFRDVISLHEFLTKENEN